MWSVDGAVGKSTLHPHPAATGLMRMAVPLVIPSSRPGSVEVFTVISVSRAASVAGAIALHSLSATLVAVASWAAVTASVAAIGTCGAYVATQSSGLFKDDPEVPVEPDVVPLPEVPEVPVDPDPDDVPRLTVWFVVVLLVVVVVVPVAEVVVVVELLVTVTGQLTDFASMTTLGPKLQLLVVAFEEVDAGFDVVEVDVVEVEVGVVEVEVGVVEVEVGVVEVEVEGVETPAATDDGDAGAADVDAEDVEGFVALLPADNGGESVFGGDDADARTETTCLERFLTVTACVDDTPGTVAGVVAWTTVVADVVPALLTDPDDGVTGAARLGPNAADPTEAPGRRWVAPAGVAKAPALMVPSPNATFISTTAKDRRPARAIHLRRSVKEAPVFPP